MASRKRAHRKKIPAYLQKMFDAYIETALWSSTDEDGRPLDDTYCPGDISVKFHNEAVDTCRDFLALCEERGLSEALGDDLWRVGHDLWLTQNRHGAGFWDGDYDRGDELTAVAVVFGEVDLYEYRGRVTC